MGSSSDQKKDDLRNGHNARPERVIDMFELASSHRFLFKPDNDVQDGGCHMDVWLPLTRDKAGLPVAMYVTKKAYVAHSPLAN